jgi:RNA polymerase sigma factor (TIGR02999 family)
VESGDISRELRAAAGGDPESAGRLLPLVYRELRALARARMRRERQGHTLQATELVHEAYLRLVRDPETDWQGRVHFFAAAAEAMRRILIEHARARARLKRGGDAEGHPPRKTALTMGGVADLAVETDLEEVMALDDAVRRLEAQDERMAKVVRLRFYAGLSIEETAATLNVAPRTVKRDWTFARAWLFEALRDRGR